MILIPKIIYKNFSLFISFFLFIFFFAFYSHLSIKLFDAHLTRGDLTNFAQAVWNTTQGRVMQNTFNYSIHNFWGDREMEISEDSNIFGIHFNPILFFIVPFYCIFSTPKTLLVFQAFFVALSGVLLFFMAIRILAPKYLGLFIQFSFYIYLPVLSAVFSEFHAYTLSIFFALLAIFLRKTKIYFYLVVLLFLLFVQENTAIGAFFLGFYLLFVDRLIYRGIMTIAVSLIYFMLAIKTLIPYMSNYGMYLFEGFYGSPLGGSISEVILNGLLDPLLLLRTILTEVNLKYLGQLLYPVAPFVIFSPAVFVLSATLLMPNLLSSATILKSIFMHYESLFVPFIFWGVILGMKNILDKVNLKQGNLFIQTCALILIILSFTQFKFFPDFKVTRQLIFGNIYLEYDKELDNLILLIPQKASVSTQDFISGHLSNRRGLFLFPVYAKNVDYLLLSSNNRSTWPLSKEEHTKIVDELLEDKNFEILYKSDNYILIKNIKRGSNS